jgi:hypothetical protein
MATTIQFLAEWNGAKTGQVATVSDALATTLIGDSVTESSELTPPTSYMGQVASESTFDFLNRVPGGTPNPGDPVRAVENDTPTIVSGILQPGPNPWAQ